MVLVGKGGFGELSLGIEVFVDLDLVVECWTCSFGFWRKC